MAPDKIDLLQGTLDLLVLETLRWGPQHGYAITQAIRARSGDVLQVETGSLYPALHRMERQKWIASAWGPPARTSAPSFTASPRRAASSSPTAAANGKR